jgi:hypothetical protein
MSTSEIFDGRSMVSSTRRVKVKRGAWRKLRFWPARRPTTFHRCLALHMAGAERVGALQGS